MIPRQAWREQWRELVYREPSISNACRVLMLLLADSMSADGQVRRPRAELAAALGVNPSRITERMNEAVEAGILERVIAGSPGQLALYTARRPDGACVRTKRPRNDGYIESREMVRRTRPSGGACVRTKQAEQVERADGACVQAAISTSATTRPNVTKRPASKSTTTKGAMPALAGEDTRTPDTSGSSSLDPLDGKVSPEAAPRQHEPTQQDEIRSAHDLLAALAPERYEQALRMAAEADENLTGAALIVAAAQLVRGAA